MSAAIDMEKNHVNMSLLLPVFESVFHASDQEDGEKDEEKGQRQKEINRGKRETSACMCLYVCMCVCHE